MENTITSDIPDELTKKRTVKGHCVLSKAALCHVATQILSLALVYGTLWSILKEDALPGSSVFALILLAVACHIGGIIVGMVKLPPLLGMLLVGFMFRNLNFIPYHQHISLKWASILRSSALVIILLRAGLGLDPQELKRLSFVCFRLALCPCLTEAVCMGVTAYFFLELPWAWSFMLGFVIAAVSPAIVVPSMLALQEKGLGTSNGITTLIIASASFDDVFAITGFGVALSIAISTGASFAWTILQGPVEVAVGFAYGGIMGIMLWYLPNSKSERCLFYRAVLLTFSGLGVMFVSTALDFAGSGALGCISVAFVAALKWRQQPDVYEAVVSVEAGLWYILQTYLFGLIGAEVSIKDLQHNIGYGMLVLVIGLVFRMLVSFLVTFGAGFTIKEKIFIAFAWLPKATVQAAIGSVALDLARTLDLPEEYIIYGTKILTIAVLSILFTAPLGAIAIALLAPCLLTKGEKLADAVPSELKKNSSDYRACVNTENTHKETAVGENSV